MISYSGISYPKATLKILYIHNLTIQMDTYDYYPTDWLRTTGRIRSSIVTVDFWTDHTLTGHITAVRPLSLSALNGPR
jgi:hypothetical protein